MGTGKFFTVASVFVLCSAARAQNDLEEAAVRDPVQSEESDRSFQAPHRDRDRDDRNDRRRERDERRHDHDDGRERERDRRRDDNEDRYGGERDHDRRRHYDHDRFDDLARVRRPFGLQFSLGDPAPSLIGIGFSYQSNAFFQWLINTGVFWTRDFRVQTVEGSVRLHILPFDLTPMVGGGVAVHFFNGQGSIQSLDESLLLGSVMLGADWTFDAGFRVSAGVQFHYPVKLVFPFVDFGLIF